MNPTSPSPARPVANPLEVRPNCWMVGHRNPASLLQCNTYLSVQGEGDSARRICVDPGSQLDFPVVESNIAQLIGSISEVDCFTLNHQDPDVVGNSPAFCEANPRIGLCVTEEVWRLVQHLQMKPGAIEFASAARSSRIRLGKHTRWQIVPTPFCHFRGAMAFYDPEIRTLFTGDLFGGLNQLGRVHLFAEEHDWAGVEQFHQIYMPSREALRYAVRQIRALRPAVEVIAPQHGYVIEGDLIEVYLERLHELLVGCDLLAVELDMTYLQGYRQVVSQLLSWAGETMSRGEVIGRLKDSEVGDGLEELVRIEGFDVKLESQGYSALAMVCNRISSGELPEFSNAMRDLVLAMCSERGLPIPPIGIGLEEGVGEGAEEES